MSSRTRTPALVLALAIAGATVVPAAADPATSAPTCGEPVTRSVTLTEDLHCDLHIAASNVTIDLAGFTLHGRIGPDWDSRGEAAWVGTTIRSGTVTGQIYLGELLAAAELRAITIRDDTSPTGAVHAGSGTRILDSHFEGNLVGVDVWDDWAGSVTVRDSTFEDNGVGYRSDAPYNELDGNRFVGNDIGVRFYEDEGSGARGSVVSNNRFDGNRIGMQSSQGAMRAWDGLSIASNRFVNNASVGLHLAVIGHWDGTAEVNRNHFQRNGHADGGHGLHIEALHLGSEGPSDALAGITVTANRALHNAGYGIHAHGVTDGGRNIASGNGAGGCIGVRCHGGGNGRLP